MFIDSINEFNRLKQEIINLFDIRKYETLINVNIEKEKIIKIRTDINKDWDQEVIFIYTEKNKIYGNITKYDRVKILENKYACFVTGWENRDRSDEDSVSVHIHEVIDETVLGQIEMFFML